MSTFPTTPQKPERFDLYTGKLRSICEMHGIKTGSREDLERFLTALAGDRHFAMDFWALIGKLSNRGGGELADDQIFALVVEGITGSPKSSENDASTKSLYSELRALLAGEDLHRPETLKVSTPGRAPMVASIDEARQRRFSAAMPLIPQPGEAERVTAGPLPSQLQLAIQNLEIVNRELREHVDQLEERVSRLEARSREAKDAALNEGRERDERSAGKPRLVLEPAEAPVEKHLSQDLFAGYSPERDRRWRKDVSLAILILAVVAAGITWQRYSGKIRQAVVELVQEDLATPPSPPALPAVTPSSVATPAGEEPIITPMKRRVLEGISRPPAADSASAASRTVSPDRAAARAEQEMANFSSAVSVAAAEMERHLVLSRVPVYPEAAKEEGIEGPVVAQALISKSGIVTRVIVIEGDSRLRNAAAEAIYRRRYRPYLVHGQPVDVATTITVNFKLDG